MVWDIAELIDTEECPFCKRLLIAHSNDEAKECAFNLGYGDEDTFGE